MAATPAPGRRTISGDCATMGRWDSALMSMRSATTATAAIFRYGAVAFFAEEAGDREWLMASIGPASSGKGDALAEEKATDEKLTRLAESKVNNRAEAQTA